MNTPLTALSLAILMSSAPALAQGLQFQSPAANMVQSQMAGMMPSPMAGTAPTVSTMGTPLRAEVQNQHRYNENEIEGGKVRAQNQERIRTQDRLKHELSSGGSGNKGGFGGGRR